MSTPNLLLLAAGLYILWKQGVFGPTFARPTVPAYSATPAGTTLVAPGVGRYTSGPGGTQITLDPSFFGRLIGRGTGEGLPAANLVPGPDNPLFPAGTESAGWSMGGVYDAYRAGERDFSLLDDTLPLVPTEDPNVYFPQDVTPEEVSWWIDEAPFVV